MSACTKHVWEPSSVGTPGRRRCSKCGTIGRKAFLNGVRATKCRTCGAAAVVSRYLGIREWFFCAAHDPKAAKGAA